MAATGPGRPSLLVQRRGEIVDAFIRLVALKGLEGVTLDDIAADAQLQRSSVRHFVGNRRELVAAAIVELTGRYAHGFREGLSGASGIDDLITLAFSRSWLAKTGDDAVAFAALIEEATRSPDLVGELRGAYDAILTEVQAPIRRDYPDATSAQIRETAYAILCLIEHNTFMQRLGYPIALSRGVARAAREMVRGLSA
jgi:AcrR family transcriptional regulator